MHPHWPAYLCNVLFSLDLIRFNEIAIQGKGPDGKWTMKPFAYR